MGVKDIEEKQLEDYNDVFADIVNVLLFNGKQVVNPDDLENSKDKSRFKAASGKITEQERDTSKWWKRSKIRITLFGFENQTWIDPEICFRLYGYDGASYKSEYGEKTKYPVITLVLHFNYEKRWRGPKSLLEGMNIPEELRPYVNDYHMNLFEIAWLTDEQVAMFKSDFKIVADYFVQMRKNKTYIPSKETIRHVDAIMKLMTALTGDTRYEDHVNDILREEKRGEVTMCGWLDEAEKRGEDRGVKIGEKRGVKIGEKRGEKRGRFEMLLSTVNNYTAKKNITQKAACEDLSISYNEYMAAKRYFKKLKLQGIQE